MIDPHAHDAGPYVLGALSPSERAAFEDHLRGCPECRRTVASFAALPQLLASVAPDVAAGLETDELPGVPPTLLDRVDAERRTARRHRLVAMLASAAAVVLFGVAGVLAVGATSDDDPAGRTTQAVVLEPVTDVPLSATAALTPVAWGTRIELSCRYGGDAGAYATPPVYALVVRSVDGEEQVATWRAVPGRDLTVQAATAVATDGIEGLEIRTDDGRRVLSVDR